MKNVLIIALVAWLAGLSYFQYETTFGESLSGKLSRLDSFVSKLDDSKDLISSKLNELYDSFEKFSGEGDRAHEELESKISEFELLMEQLGQRTSFLEESGGAYEEQLAQLNKDLKKKSKPKSQASKVTLDTKEVPSILNINVWGSKRIAGIFCDRKFMGFYGAGDVLNKDWTVASVSANSVTFVDSNGVQQTRYL